MSRSNKKRRRETPGVSLFPFLAVLICTMGVLIVLLVIAVQSASVDSQTALAEYTGEQTQRLKEAQEKAEFHAFEVQSLTEARREVSDRLSLARADREYLLQQIRETEASARVLADQYRAMQAIAGQRDAETETNNVLMQANVASLKASVAMLESQVATARETANSQPPRRDYQIVPYSGTGGTDRRPIFVECTAGGLTLQPHGVTIATEDFVDPSAIGNLLDSVLIAIRGYYQKHQLDDATTRAYPLLVVRPDGASNYMLARHAMLSWDDEFGYELVEAGTPLNFGVADAQLTQTIIDEIATAKRRQLAIARNKAMRSLSEQGELIGDRFASVNEPSNAHGRRGSDAPGNESGSSESFASGFNASQRNRDLSDDKSPNEYSVFEKPAEHPPIQSQNRRVASSQQPASSQQSLSSSQGPSSQARPASSQEGSGPSVAGSGDPQSIASFRGRNWALPSHTSGAAAYVRPIRLSCEANRIQVLSQDQIVATIEIADSMERATGRLVSEVWKTIDQWGIAGDQAFWKPELRFSVMPGGERRFAQLQAMLDESGLIVEKIR